MKRLMTIQDVSTRFRIHRSTLHRMVRSGRFPRPYYRGGRPVWLAAIIHDYEARQKRICCTSCCTERAACS